VGEDEGAKKPKQSRIFPADVRVPFIDMMANLAVLAHGMPRVITPGALQAQMHEIRAGLRCGKGCYHTWKLVEANFGGKVTPVWMEEETLGPEGVVEAIKEARTNGGGGGS